MSLLRLSLRVMCLCSCVTLDSVAPPCSTSTHPWGPALAPQHQPVQGLQACTCSSPSGPKCDRPFLLSSRWFHQRFWQRIPEVLPAHTLLCSLLKSLGLGLFSHCSACLAPELLSEVGRKRNRLKTATSSGFYVVSNLINVCINTPMEAGGRWAVGGAGGGRWRGVREELKKHVTCNLSKLSIEEGTDKP